MKLYSVAFCIIFIGNIRFCSTLPRRLCDIRIWYLNLIANDVFSSAKTTKQMELKDSIESLVLSTPDKPEARIKECHVLEIYNGLLKETFEFDISKAKQMRNYEVEDNDSMDIDNKPKQNDDRNILNGINSDTQVVNEIHDGADGENAKQIHTLEENESKSKNTDDTTKQTDSNGVLSVKASDTQEHSTVNKDMTNVKSVEDKPDSSGSDLKSVDTFSEHVIDDGIDSATKDDTNSNDGDTTVNIGKHTETYVEIDETELGDEDEEEVETDDAVDNDTYSNETAIENDRVLHNLTTNTTNKRAPGKLSIPFGICWSFGCFRSEVFGRLGVNTVQQPVDVEFKQKHFSVNKAALSVEMCQNRTVCYPFCYLYFSKTHCMLDYGNSSPIIGTETIDYERELKIKYIDSNDISKDGKVDKEHEIVNNPLSMEDALPYKLQNENQYIRNTMKEQTHSDETLNGDKSIVETKHDSKISNDKSKEDTESDKSFDKITYKSNILEQNSNSGDKNIDENNKESNHKTMSSVKNIDDTDNSNSNIIDSVNEHENQIDNIEKAYKDSTYEHQEYIKGTKNELSLDEFEKLIHKKTSDYSHKIQALELMIVNLEKQLLMEQLNKQNHSSTYTRLENLVLKLENDLLRMNKYYQNLRDDTEAMQKKQNNYLELAYKKEDPSVADKSTEQFEVITKQQSKLAELTEILGNQSHAIQQLKHRHESLEELNRMLHQMVMNQTIFMTSIIQTVQDLSEQNNKNKQDMFELKQKLDSALDSNKKLETYIEKSKQSNLFDTREPLASDTYIQNQHSEKKQTSQGKIENSAEDFLTKWCPVKTHTCPACYYNSVMITNCLPYRNLFWLNCKGSCQSENSFLPKSPGVKDNTTKDVPESTQTVKKPDSVEKEVYSPTNIDMATIDVKSEKHEENVQNSKSITGTDTNNVKNEGRSIKDNPKDIVKSYEQNAELLSQPNEHTQVGDQQPTKEDSKVIPATKSQEKPIVDNSINSKETSKFSDKRTQQEDHVVENKESVQQQAENKESHENIKTDIKMDSKRQGETQRTSTPVYEADLPNETPNEKPKDDSKGENDIVINNKNSMEREHSQVEHKESVQKNYIKIDTSKPENGNGSPPNDQAVEAQGVAANIQQDNTATKSKEETGNDSPPSGQAERQGVAANIKQDNTASKSEEETKGIETNKHIPPKPDIEILDDSKIKNQIKDSDKSKEEASKQNDDKSANQRMSTNQQDDNGLPQFADSQTTSNKAQEAKEKVIVDKNANTNTDPAQKPASSAKDETINKASTSKSDKKLKSDTKPKRKEPINMGKEKQKEAKDCYEIKKRGSRGDGIYKIRPLGSNRVLEVFCDMKKGGWTVIQRRQDGDTDFFLDWEDYKKGFGGLYGEHYIGNDALHFLTNQDYYKLRVELIDWDKNKRYAEFGYFLVDSEEEGYRLHIEEYSGDAGDGLTKHNGHKFSTKDVDNDKVVKELGGSCAKRFHGAGWYYKCYASNLNGRYYKDGKIPEKQFDGVTWKPWTGPNYSIKKVVMKVRPASATD